MKTLIILSLLASAAPVQAQVSGVVNATPLASVPGPDGSTRVLRGGAQVRVRFIHEITTEGKASKVGDRPRMEVAENVTVDGITVIPQGTPVTGELTAVRNKGMWGKSGKIEGRVLNLSLNGRTIRMSGAFDDKGVTGTAGVVAAAVFVPVVGFFVTGPSARIPANSQISSYIDEDISFAVTPGVPLPPLQVAAPMPVQSAPIQATAN